MPQWQMRASRLAEASFPMAISLFVVSTVTLSAPPTQRAEPARFTVKLQFGRRLRCLVDCKPGTLGNSH